MREMLLGTIMLLSIIWGYTVMKKIDAFLEEWGRSENSSGKKH